LAVHYGTNDWCLTRGRRFGRKCTKLNVTACTLAAFTARHYAGVA